MLLLVLNDVISLIPAIPMKGGKREDILYSK